MKTTTIRYTLAALLMAAPMVATSWDGAQKQHDWKKDACPKKPCPIVKPVCPVFNGENGFVVGDNDEDTLAAAINAANASDATPCNPFVIEFDLPAGEETITLNSDLPVITKPVCINGFANIGASEFCRTIVVSICSLGSAQNGLVLGPTACGSTIKGFNIFGFTSGSGILVRASGSLIAGNNIGDATDQPSGCGPNGSNKNNSIGIDVEGAQKVTIGGLCPQEKNIISGNFGQGILINSDHVTVVGNYIGTDETGLLARPNLEGVVVMGDHNVIGCEQSTGENLISGNTFQNVSINGACNKAVNNIIGLDRFGKRALMGSLGTTGNITSATQQGISITGLYNTVTKSVISAHSQSNVLLAGSYNSVNCNIIGTDACGTKAFSSTSGISIGGQLITGINTTSNILQNNLVTVRDGTGILVVNASSTVIRKNLIGSGCKQKCLFGQAIGIDIQSIACISKNQPTTTCKLTSPSNACISYRDVKRVPPKPTGSCERPCGKCSLESGCCPTVPQAGEAVDTCIKDNIILGNTCAGIRLTSTTRFTTIEQNSIGINKKCCVVPNGYGILLEDGSQNNHITCNLIVGSLFDGVAVQGVVPSPCVTCFAQTLNNALTKNSIFGNCGSGIRLIAGGNNCLSAPLITSATACDGKLEVVIDTASLPETPFRVELYANVNARKCISEGQVFICCKTIEEQPDSPQLVLATKLPCSELKFITATVTQLTTCFDKGNTSEYSCPMCIDHCIQV